MENIKKEKNRKIIKIAVAALLVIIYVFLITTVVFQNDVLFDIKLGEKYVSEGIVLQDSFSIHDNLKYVSHHFMVTIITYFTYRYFGFNGVYVLEIILAALLGLAFYNANKLYVKNNKLSYLLVFVELFLIRDFISQRAQLYSYIIFLIEIICIEKFLRKKSFKHLFLLSILPLILANFHAGVIPFYFVIIFVYALNIFKIKIGRIESEKIYTKNIKYLVIPVIVGTLLSFVNPFGIDLVIYPYKTIFNNTIMSNISEFKPATILGAIYIYLFVFAILIIYFCSKQKIKLHQLLLFIGTSYMAFSHVRYYSLLLLVMVTNLNLLEEVLEVIKKKIVIGIQKEKEDMYLKVLYISFIIIVFVFAIKLYIFKEKEVLPDNIYPNQAITYIKENISKESKIFNMYDWGTLMMFNDIKVFIDSRCDLYLKEYNNVEIAKDFFDVYHMNVPYTDVFEKYNIDYVFMPKSSKISKFLEEDERYSQVYKDDISTIFKVRK